MSMVGRNSLRKSLATLMLPKKLVVRKDRMKGRLHFRTIVRLVLEHKFWLTEKPPEDITGDVEIDVHMAKLLKGEKKIRMTIEDRSHLLTRINDRVKSNRVYIFQFFKKIHAFKKYPDDIRYRLASMCDYQYLRTGRVIVRQGRRAENLYYIITGTVGLSRIEKDKYTGEFYEVNMGTMTTGDMFGEIALLHDIPRTATVVTNTVVDLLVLKKDHFDSILKTPLLEEWDVLQDALIHFNYFKGWDKKMIRECCILSRVKDFNVDEVLLGDGKGMVNYVHFILKGQCRLIEHILVKTSQRKNKTYYKLYDPDKNSKAESSSSVKEVYTKIPKQKVKEERKTDFETEKLYNEQYEKNFKHSKTIEEDRASIVTATLQDVLTGWQEITDIAAILLNEPSVTFEQKYSNDIHTIFMQLCTFYRGACFGLGEIMKNRRIVAVTPVKCLLVPRNWLFEYNRANIWARVTMFINSMYPSKEKLFEEFMRDRKWTEYKREMVQHILNSGRYIPIDTTVHDVPYSIRIVQGI